VTDIYGCEVQRLDNFLDVLRSLLVLRPMKNICTVIRIKTHVIVSQNEKKSEGRGGWMDRAHCWRLSFDGLMDGLIDG